MIAGLAILTAGAIAAAGSVVWEYRRVVELRTQVARLAAANRAGVPSPLPRQVPPYDASARQFLRERGAGWAPMLRTLESGAMIGVTPTAVEFNAADGVARVELNYVDSTALFDYLGRINEGVAPEPGLTRWTLVQTQLQSGAPQGGGLGMVGVEPSTTQSVATIRSAWQESSALGQDAMSARLLRNQTAHASRQSLFPSITP